MRGSTFWTDHKLVRVKLRLALIGSHGRLDRRAPPIAVWKLTDASIREDYCRELSDRLEGDDACGAEGGWEQLRDCVVASAVKVVGCGHRRQPNWFLESEQQLSPLLAAKCQAWTECCVMIPLPPVKDSGCVSTGLSMQSEMLRKLELRRLQRLPILIRMGGDIGVVLSSFRRFFVVDSVRTSGVRREDGQLLSGPAEVVARWFRHFAGVLNVSSQFAQECVDSMPSCEVRSDLDDPLWRRSLMML